MFAVSRFADYAARVVLHLACQVEGTRVSIPELASARGLPVPFLRRVVSRLAEEGILRSVRGPNGGISLARPPAEISLGDVLLAAEGPSCPSPCLEAPQGCPFASGCPVRDVWAEADRVLHNHLASVRFSELAEAEGHRAAHRRTPPARRTTGNRPPRA